MSTNNNQKSEEITQINRSSEEHSTTTTLTNATTDNMKDTSSHHDEKSIVTTVSPSDSTDLFEKSNTNSLEGTQQTNSMQDVNITNHTSNENLQVSTRSHKSSPTVIIENVTSRSPGAKSLREIPTDASSIHDTAAAPSTISAGVAVSVTPTTHSTVPQSSLSSVTDSLTEPAPPGSALTPILENISASSDSTASGSTVAGSTTTVTTQVTAVNIAATVVNPPSTMPIGRSRASTTNDIQMTVGATAPMSHSVPQHLLRSTNAGSTLSLGSLQPSHSRVSQLFSEHASHHAIAGSIDTIYAAPLPQTLRSVSGPLHQPSLQERAIANSISLRNVASDTPRTVSQTSGSATPSTQTPGSVTNQGKSMLITITDERVDPFESRPRAPSNMSAFGSPPISLHAVTMPQAPQSGVITGQQAVNAAPGMAQATVAAPVSSSSSGLGDVLTTGRFLVYDEKYMSISSWRRMASSTQRSLRKQRPTVELQEQQSQDQQYNKTREEGTNSEEKSQTNTVASRTKVSAAQTTTKETRPTDPIVRPTGTSVVRQPGANTPVQRQTVTSDHVRYCVRSLSQIRSVLMNLSREVGIDASSLATPAAHVTHVSSATHAAQTSSHSSGVHSTQVDTPTETSQSITGTSGIAVTANQRKSITTDTPTGTTAVSSNSRDLDLSRQLSDARSDLEKAELERRKSDKARRKLEEELRTMKEQLTVTQQKLARFGSVLPGDFVPTSGNLTPVPPIPAFETQNFAGTPIAITLTSQTAPGDHTKMTQQNLVGNPATSSVAHNGIAPSQSFHDFADLGDAHHLSGAGNAKNTSTGQSANISSARAVAVNDDLGDNSSVHPRFVAPPIPLDVPPVIQNQTETEFNETTSSDTRK